MKRHFFSLSAVLVMAVFVFFPFPPSDLHIRINFDDITGNLCALYYSTDITDGFVADQYIVSEINDNKQAHFCIDSSLAGHITGLRIDWPDAEQLICIKSITISSAGIIQKEYDPCRFFQESNIMTRNGIDDVVLVRPRKRAYILTASEDPYMVLSAGLTDQIQDCYSHYRLTRLAVCVFLIGCFFSWKNNFFRDKAEETSRTEG